MEASAALTTDILALGTLALQIVTLILLVTLVAKRDLLRPLVPFILPIVFFVSLAGSVLTLVYSEIFGLIPCGLCWLERIALYPIPLLAGIALWTRDTGVGKYVLGLSIPGFVIALYHHYIQMGGAEIVGCPAAGASDCAQRFIFELGYITFPLMAATLFAFLIALMLVRRKLGTR